MAQCSALLGCRLWRDRASKHRPVAPQGQDHLLRLSVFRTARGDGEAWAVLSAWLPVSTALLEAAQGPRPAPRDVHQGCSRPRPHSHSCHAGLLGGLPRSVSPTHVLFLPSTFPRLPSVFSSGCMLTVFLFPRFLSTAEDPHTVAALAGLHELDCGLLLKQQTAEAGTEMFTWMD